MFLGESEIQVTVQEQMRVIYFAAFWSIIALVLASHNGLFKPFNSTKNTAIRGVHVLLCFCLVIIFEMVIAPILVAVIYYFMTGNFIEFKLLTPSMLFWINFTINVAKSVLLFIFYKFLLSDDQKKTVVGVNNKPWYKNYLFGASLWFFIFPFILLWNKSIDILITFFFQKPPLEQVAVERFRGTLGNPVWFVLMGLTIAIIVPMVEEFLFRGLLQSWLRQRLKSSVLAIILSAAIFAIFHFSSSHGLSNISLLSSIFILGCFLGFLYEREKSLWASIGLHSLFNAITAISIIMDF